MSRSDGTIEESHGAPAERHGFRFDRAHLKALWHAALPLLVLVAIAFIDFPVCPTRLGFGVPCPGCGLTRASVAMMHFDLAGVLRYHPLAPILTPLVAWSFGKPILLQLGWLKPEWLRKLPRPPQWFWWAVGAALIALWIGRLFGYFGGLPDPVDLSEGWLFRAGHGMWGLIAGG